MHPLDVRAARRADAPPLVRRLDQRAQRVGERVLRRGDDRHLDAERLLRAPHRLVVEERDDRLAERHRLDREHAVPAGVQLVDDDVGVAVALERLAMVEPFDDLELDVELLAGRDDVLRPFFRARRRRVQHDRALAVGRRRRLDRADVDPRGNDVRVRHPADRVVRADDTRARALRPGELRRRLAADVGAEEVHDRALAERAQQRELHRLRQQRQPEVEVEDVRLRREPRERAPLRELAADQSTRPREGRRLASGMEAVALEDDELRVDAAGAAPGRSSTGSLRC